MADRTQRALGIARRNAHQHAFDRFADGGEVVDPPPDDLPPTDPQGPVEPYTMAQPDYMRPKEMPGWLQRGIDIVAAPGRAMQAKQPQAGEMWSDVDEATRQANEAAAPQWGADVATSAAGAGAPFAAEGAAGIFGGKLAKTADQAMFAKAQEMVQAGATREDIWNSTGWFQGADLQWRFEIPDNPSVFRNSIIHGRDVHGNVAQYLQHPDLHAAYPDLRKIPLTVGQAPMARGRYIPNMDRGDKFFPQTEEMEVYAATKPQARSVLLHELQHAIQDRERFAKGASPGEFTYQNTPWFPHRSPYETPMEAYHRTAGEVEARNVQRRLFMTPEERTAEPPWATEDVPHPKQIVRQHYEGGGSLAGVEVQQAFDRAFPR